MTKKTAMPEGGEVERADLSGRAAGLTAGNGAI
jgi:hypothetical protein